MSKTLQQLKIEKYFNLLVEEFITDPEHRDITIVFVDSLGETQTEEGKIIQMGLTNKYTREHIGWQVDAWGNKRLNSEKITYTYYYVITFLTNYENDDEWRGTVCHEFTHLYLYSTLEGNHEHDDNFYSHMEMFEDWLDKNQGWEPRPDKSGDRFQYQDWEEKYKPRQKNPQSDWEEKQQPSPWHQHPLVIIGGVGLIASATVLIISALIPKKKKTLTFR